MEVGIQPARRVSSNNVQKRMVLNPSLKNLDSLGQKNSAKVCKIRPYNDDHSSESERASSSSSQASPCSSSKKSQG